MNREEVERANVAQLAHLFRKHGELKNVLQKKAEPGSDIELTVPKFTNKQAAAAA